MDTHKRLRIGLFGFGVVGEGLYKVLQQTPSLKAEIIRVCIKNPEKKRDAPAELFTTDPDKLLDDPQINVIVEVINESEPAFRYVSKALRNGKDVVSASKKMLAEHLPELLQLQQETGRSLLYEASACASIPVIRNLEEYYDNDLLHSIKGIVNGSTNFILTKMFEDKLDFKQALLLAQQLGFAESDPSLDVEGTDAANKWCLLLTHAYGASVHPSQLLYNGIQDIQAADAAVATEKGFSIKLVAQAQKLGNGNVAGFVLPQFVKHDDHLSFVKNEYNGVVIESGFADKQFFYGKGAGSFPTASAVLSDISALRYQYRYEYKKRFHHQALSLTDDFYLRVYVSFDHWDLIPREDFVSIDEWHADSARKYLVGLLPFKVLRNGSWWRENNTSLILMPDPVIENLDVQELKKKSLELAGVI
jgi:homoserine dehydrogenase